MRVENAGNFISEFLGESSNLCKGGSEQRKLKDAEIINIRFFSRRKPHDDYIKRCDERSLE